MDDSLVIAPASATFWRILPPTSSARRRSHRALVLGRGLEPLILSETASKTVASANFATRAIGFSILDCRFSIGSGKCGFVVPESNRETIG